MIKRFLLFIFWTGATLLAIYQLLTSNLLSPLAKRIFPAGEGETRLRAPKKLPKDNAVTLHLKNGSVISGEFLWEDEARVMMRWQGGDVAFVKEEIERIERGKVRTEKEGMLFPERAPEEWPYRNDVVVVLKNQQMLDEKIASVEKDAVILRRELEEGGVIEQEIHRLDIEYLSFKPIRNERSRRIEEALRTQFPKMKWYRDGAFLLITDSYATWVDEYRKTIRDLRTDFYLTFFPLLKDREPKVAHYVVIFDEWGDFIEYAASDGVPGWAVAGYFSPTHEVLFLFNTLGDTFSTLIEEAIVGQTGRVMNQAAEAVKGQVDRRYHVFVEGQAHDIMKKFAAYHSVMKGWYRDQTIETLRHEMTHELFHNYGLQGIIVSKVAGYDKKEAEKKRAFLEEKDIQRKRELLLELAQLRGTLETIQMEASNSWLVEGLAAFMQSVPLGSENRRWLYLYQESKRKNAVTPIEHLTVYKMGSFPGVAYGAMEYAYAESWAFVHFLMSRYPMQFMNYLERMSREKPKEDEDILWLLEALGVELRTLENEFLEYMKQFQELEDPYLERMDQVQHIFQQR
ncbi:MAG: DUF1570 domain-containing protein [Candidatus Omnitrophica bacterium]|nr:DUF1570 domain-containing protein [Candidatus Omnitrophota bacterium]